MLKQLLGSLGQLDLRQFGAPNHHHCVDLPRDRLQVLSTGVLVYECASRLLGAPEAPLTLHRRCLLFELLHDYLGVRA